MEREFSHDVFISFSFKDQAVAENISNQLNHIYGIPCWICTTEIRAGDGFYDIISDAITASKVLLFVQTKNSVQSKEIPDEVCQAIGDGKTIVSFVVEDSELRGTLKLKLSGKQFVDGKKPTLDDRIEDLARELCKILGRPFKKGGIAEAEEKEQKLKLKATPAEQLKPRRHFYGRDDLLTELHEKFEKGERVVFLQGIGGIGKTQIAKNYVKKYGSDYDTVVYATYGGSISDLILSDAPFTFDPPMNRLTKADGSKESDAEFFERKIAALRACATEKTLLILDNFDTRHDPDFEFLRGVGCRMLVTTRYDYESAGNSAVRVEEIESIDDLQDVFLSNYGSRAIKKGDPRLIELIELVNRHTYAVELLAQHMAKKKIRPSAMVALLKEKGLESMDAAVGDVGQKEKKAYDTLRDVFMILGLKEEEQRVLTHLSLMPTEGVDIFDFCEWIDEEESELIDDLQKRSLIIENVGGIALHPIVREVVRCEAPVTKTNALSFVNNAAKAFRTLWGRSQEKKVSYKEIAKSFYTTLPEEYTHDINIFRWILYTFQLTDSVDLVEKYIKEVKGSWEGSDSLELGWFYWNVSDICLLYQQFERSLEYNRLCIDVMKRAGAPDYDLAYVYKHRAHTYHAMVQHISCKPEWLAKGKTCLEESEKLFERAIKSDMPFGSPYYSYGLDLTKEHASQKGSWYYACGINALYGGQYEDAIEYSELSLEVFMKINGEIHGDTTAPMKTLAMAYSKVGRYEDAVKMEQRVLAIREQLWGKNQFAYFEQIEVMANIHIDNKHVDKGIAELNRLLDILKEKKNYPAYTEKIKAKLRSYENENIGM